jgi:vacuolar-type H+-ATPase subunit C/Vma6
MTLRDLTDGGRVVDLYAISVLLRAKGWEVPPATLRQWAHRYPDLMPVLGRQGRRSLYHVDDVVAVAERVRGTP